MVTVRSKKMDWSVREAILRNTGRDQHQIRIRRNRKKNIGLCLAIRNHCFTIIGAQLLKSPMGLKATQSITK